MRTEEPAGLAGGARGEFRRVLVQHVGIRRPAKAVIGEKNVFVPVALSSACSVLRNRAMNGSAEQGSWRTAVSGGSYRERCGRRAVIAYLSD
ncbi:hypothetical protein [Streptomyces sp. cmx-10-25]|uniref:hypothetical protein n=1 Tax=Streptomyces sp. cmx-10-25 TaxID=2790919 RepID=UPI0039805AE1